tara:strand:+ start:802 stop:1161 length:360 start_codon:yes stop_codon:yes gene_type:complete
MILPRDSRTITEYDAPSLVRVVSETQAAAIESGVKMSAPAAAMIVRDIGDTLRIAIRGSLENASAIYILFPEDPSSSTYETLRFDGCFDPLIYAKAVKIEKINRRAYQHYSNQLEKLKL